MYGMYLSQYLIRTRFACVYPHSTTSGGGCEQHYSVNKENRNGDAPFRSQQRYT